MPNFILSTCGTSLLTNGLAVEPRRVLAQAANKTLSELSTAEKSFIDDRAQLVSETLRAAPFATIQDLSAELNGLICFYSISADATDPQSLSLSLRHSASGDVPDSHMILCSDTYQGATVGGIIVDRLLQEGHQAISRTVPGLRTDSLDGLRAALAELTLSLEQELSAYRASGYRIIFNLTGGFKSVNGFLQSLAMFQADECIYVFEARPYRLLRMPRLPIRMDTASVITDHTDIFRRLGRGDTLPSKDCKGIPETLLFEIDGQATLSEWGALIWAGAKQDLYATTLLPPLSPKLSWTSGFAKAVRALPPDRLALVNTRLDDMARYLEGGPNPASLSLKAIVGNPVHGATHQAYAWSDGAAMRMFGRISASEYFEFIQFGGHL